MRRFTLITIVFLLSTILAAAVVQLMMASGDRERYPGPVPGTPYPELATP